MLHYGRHRDAAEAVAAELPAGRCHLVHADLAVPGSAAQLWKESVAWQGHVGVVVNNAAVATSTRIEDPLEQWESMWRETLQVNVMAVADICREALLHYRSRGGGTIINIASRAAFRGDEPDYMHYAASKGAVVALTKSIARGFGREHVVAYGIAPGWVLTDMARPADSGQRTGRAHSRYSLGRHGVTGRCRQRRRLSRFRSRATRHGNHNRRQRCVLRALGRLGLAAGIGDRAPAIQIHVQRERDRRQSRDQQFLVE